MDFDLLLADLAQNHWAHPHDIQAVNEEHEYEEALMPLDDLFMQHLPPLNDPEFAFNALPIQHQVAGALQSSHWSYVNEPEDWRPWREYEGMGYVGVEEDNEEEWKISLQQLEVDGPEEMSVEDEITVDKSSQERRLIVVTGLGTKRINPVTEDSMLLQAINPSAPHIATIGLLEPAMPDASTTATFGPTLEPVVSHYQHQTVARAP